MIEPLSELLARDLDVDLRVPALADECRAVQLALRDVLADAPRRDVEQPGEL